MTLKVTCPSYKCTSLWCFKADARLIPSEPWTQSEQASQQGSWEWQYLGLASISGLRCKDDAEPAVGGPEVDPKCGGRRDCIDEVVWQKRFGEGDSRNRKQCKQKIYNSGR